MQSKSPDLRVHAAEASESLAARIVHGVLRYFDATVFAGACGDGSYRV
jgi:hypothetical protein